MDLANQQQQQSVIGSARSGPSTLSILALATATVVLAVAGIVWTAFDGSTGSSVGAGVAQPAEQVNPLVDPAYIRHRNSEQGAQAAQPANLLTDPAYLRHRNAEQGVQLTQLANPLTDPAYIRHRNSEQGD